MNLKEGDILRKGSKFYRVLNFTKKTNDVVCNQVLYNPKKETLVIAHDVVYVDLDDVEKKIYEKVPTKDAKQLLEIVKRKYKLLKLENLNKEDGSNN